MASVQPARDPLEIAMDFIKRINAGSADAVCEMMTADHIFQDALGERFIGRDKMREGWRGECSCGAGRSSQVRRMVV